jgi:hypothetical protein
MIRKIKSGKQGTSSVLGGAPNFHQLPRMAWRIDEQVKHGEIDNRRKGHLTGRIWFTGREEPVELELTGNPWADLAGHMLRFRNPDPKPGLADGFAARQEGVVGDITASRKVKVPDCSKEEFLKCYEEKRPFPWHWANSLYLEWFSLTNGRVVIESGSFELEIGAEPAWTMEEGDEEAQRIRNAEALTSFMDRLGAVMAEAEEDFDDDEPQSEAEAKAEAETEWMNRLLDRVTARIEREGLDEIDFDVIYNEERERLRRECGIPPEPEPTPEQEAQSQEWIEEMNAAAQEALEEMESEAWKDKPEPQRPALLDRAMDFSMKLRNDIKEWMPEESTGEHPLREIAWGVQLAAVKIGGALGHDDDEPWPPEALFAGDSLVRLKKSRDCLRDALLAMDSADAENLAPAPWRIATRREIAEILGEVQTLVRELRDVLKENGDEM